MFRTILAFAAVFTAAGSAHAGVIFYTSEVSWQAATGPVTAAENFSGFAVDTSFRTAPVVLAVGTIQQAGTDTNALNIVDVPPLASGGPPMHDGTALGLIYTNFPEGVSSGVQVQLAFPGPSAAFGFQTWGAGNAEGAVLEVYNGATLLGSLLLSNGNGDFAGFVTTGGDAATSIRLRSNSLSAGNLGEGYSIDNLRLAARAAAVPEPVSVAALGLLAVGGLAARRARGVTRPSR